MITKIAARSTVHRPAAPPKPVAETIKRISTDSSAIIAGTTVLLFILACVFVGEFATVTNLRALFLSVALVGIAAVGLSIITIIGRLFALSVSAMVAVSTIVFASLLHTGPWPAMAAAVLFGALAGAVQGFFVGRLGTDPIVTTIAAAAILIGFAQIVTGGRNVQGTGDASIFGLTIFGVLPLQVLAFFVLTVLAWWTHRYTVLGRRVTLVGLNEKAALVSGTRAWPVVLFAFIVSGALAGLAGGLLSSESGQGNLQLGGTFGFDAITAVVVGGVSVKGGTGNPVGAATGAILVGLLGNALVLLGLSYEVQLIFKGVLVLLAVVATGIASNRQSGRKR